MTIIWFLIISLKLAITLGQFKMTFIWVIITYYSLKLGFALGQTVTIPDGTLRGTTNQTEKGNVTFYAFRGIPFAKPPIGDLRFASPVKNDPWTGTLDATQDRDVCTQADASVAGGVAGSEDCLHINVYTTSLTGSLPVMVFIHGGGFTLESASYDEYAPDALLDKGVMYVAMNYRIGIFGFLSTEDMVAPGNWGLKDQVLALQWVQDNIANFGGDPTKVTLFGQSAGAASISYLLQSNLTTGLYRGAIMNSGTSLCLWTLARDAKSVAFAIGAKLGIVALTSQTLVDNLRKADYKDLKLAEANVTTVTYLAKGFLAGFPVGVVKEPVHSGAILTGASYDILKKGGFQKVPVIIGYDSNELGATESSIDSLKVILALYDAMNARLAPYDLRPTGVGKIAAGNAVKNRYFGILGLVATSATSNFIKLSSVDQFVRPVRETALLMSVHASVYYYKFLYKGEINPTNQTYTGVGHSDELSYLFGRRGLTDATDILMADKYSTLYTNFVKNGDPSSTNSSSSIGELTWVPNTPNDNNTSTTIKYLAIDTTIEMSTNPDQTDWTFYKNLYNTFGVLPWHDTY